MSALADLRGSRELLVNLTRREVTGKYKRSDLGQGWSLVNPVATLLIYSVVFGLVLRVPPGIGDPSGLENFAFFLAAALLPWTFFSNALNGGMGSLLANGNLVKKVWFPREVLVAAAVLALDVTFAVELAVLTVALLLIGAAPLAYLPALLVLALLLTAFGLGLGLALSVLNVYFRDTTHFLGIFLQVWFYATPIIYPVKLVEDAVTGRYGAAGGPEMFGVQVPLMDLYQVNPMTAFVEGFRNCFYDNRWPDAWLLLECTAWAAVSMALGYWIFTRFAGRLAEEL